MSISRVKRQSLKSRLLAGKPRFFPKPPGVMSMTSWAFISTLSPRKWFLARFDAYPLKEQHRLRCRRRLWNFGHVTRRSNVHDIKEWLLSISKVIGKSPTRQGCNSAYKLGFEKLRNTKCSTQEYSRMYETKEPKKGCIFLESTKKAENSENLRKAQIWHNPMVKSDTAEAVTLQPLTAPTCACVQVLYSRVLENVWNKSLFWTEDSGQNRRRRTEKEDIERSELMLKRLMTFDMMCSILNAQITVNS